MMARLGSRVLLVVLATLAISGCELPEAEFGVGRRAPSFQAADLAGRSVSLAEMRGEVVLLNVWATWCLPCRREMPSFESLYQEFGRDGFRVVAVSVDAANEEREIRRFMADYGISFDVLHDPRQTIVQKFRTRGVPETFLIGRDGVLLKHWIGRIDGHSENVRGPVRMALSET